MHFHGALNINCSTVVFIIDVSAFHNQSPLITILGSLNTEPEETTLGKGLISSFDVLGSEIKETHLALPAYFSAELSEFPLFDPGLS